MLSPSKIAVIRCETFVCLTIEVATASVGLITAPSATPQLYCRPGISSVNTQPSTNAETTTRTTDSKLTVPNSRRRSVAGKETEAE